MFTPLEKNRKQEHGRLLENITELHSRIYACRSMVLAALKKENLEATELKQLARNQLEFICTGNK